MYSFYQPFVQHGFPCLFWSAKRNLYINLKILLYLYYLNIFPLEIKKSEMCKNLTEFQIFFSNVRRYISDLNYMHWFFGWIKSTEHMEYFIDTQCKNWVFYYLIGLKLVYLALTHFWIFYKQMHKRVIAIMLVKWARWFSSWGEKSSYEVKLPQEQIRTHFFPKIVRILSTQYTK